MTTNTNKQKSDTTSIWRTNAPPGPQSVRAGDRWEFYLPVVFSGKAPVCSWSSSILKEGQYTISDDTLTIAVNIPPDEKGVHKVHYRVSTSPPMAGLVLLKVLPANESGEVDDNIVSFSPEPVKVEKKKVEVKPDSLPNCDYDSSLILVETEKPVLSGNYFVEIYRDNIPIPQLRTHIEVHKSLLAGKFSRSKNILPDLDLKPHFESKDMARQCSRKQAKIYWKNDRIVVKNLGKSRLYLPGNNLETGDAHYWQAGEEIRLPGGLIMVLTKEA